MSAPDRNAERHAFVPIEWWPGAFALSAIIKRSRVKLSLLRRLTNFLGFTAYTWTLVRGVTKYKDWALCDPKLVREGCGDWTFGKAINLEWASETMEFVWNPPIPRPEGLPENTFNEVLVDELWTADDYSWPAILADLQLILDQTKVRQTGYSLDLNAAVDRGLWRDGVNRPSDMRVRTYASTQMPPRKKVRCDPPMPTQIRGDVYGQPIRLPACLHPLVELESINSDDAVIYDCTPSKSAMRIGNKLTYRPTNHQTWVQHVCSNKVTNNNGLFRRVEITVFPPPMTAITYT